jgi:hypothetical protein
VLEPKQGELKAASHQNIKMSLIPGTYPVHFEGEIQCTIEWEEPMGQEQGGKQADLKSQNTTTHTDENKESLFLRLRKRA